MSPMAGDPWLATRATAETRSLHKPPMIGVPIIPYVLGSTLVFVRRRERTQIVTAPPMAGIARPTERQRRFSS